MNRIARRSRRGFTLLEVLMVIVIIGILAAFIVPNFFNVGEDAKKKLTRAAIESGLNGTLDQFRLAVGRFPTSDEGLAALVTKPDSEEVAAKWSGPYVKDGKNLKDAWGNEYVYVSPGQVNEDTYDLSSPGPNGRSGDDDDITNWQRS